MDKILISHNKHWNKKYTSLYKRDLFQKLVKNLSIKHIQVLQGIRRSGKSTLFKLLINHCMTLSNPKEILYINLEDPFFINYSNDPAKLYGIVETAQKLTGKKIKYLFLDEVQAIAGWEKYVKVVYDNEEFEKIFVTGSNSSLLNSEFARLLTGRYMSDMVYPLSFSEILSINGIVSYFELIENRPKVLGIVDTMLKYGSFVEVFDNEDEFKRDIISTYYDTIILKDCVTINAIRDIKSFKELSYYLVSNITSLYSYNSLAKAVGIHDKSSKEYVQYLQDAYLLSELKQFCYSLKEQQKNKKKPYLIDNGFINLSFKFSLNSGAVLENLVFSELHKLKKELYFYNKGFECDFIIKNDDNTFEAIQVCYELNDQNQKRETGGLKKIEKFIKVAAKTIITYNQEETIEDIKIVPFWKFFSKV
ncbi:MAG: ATP-binding protein [Deltaproteobacteria bacterium]|nr:ATP-binding protein [Deltaproteobacteria bacterium]